MQHYRPLLFWLLLLTGIGCASQRLPVSTAPADALSILEFGAKADGRTKNTDSIARAIDAVARKGGGAVRVPAGDFLTGAIVLKSNVRLHLDFGAILRFSTDVDDYPVVLTRWEGTECMNFAGLISARDAHDIAITGQGTIDGQGAAWWTWKDRSRTATKRLRELGETINDPAQRVFGTADAGLRPCLFEPINCQRILIEGVTFKSSPFWTIHPVYCSTISACDLTILGDGPNTDGLDPDSCSEVLIENCTFDTGDDCITLKSGRDRDGRRVGKPTENVIIRHCTFRNGHGAVTIGSEMSGGVRNVIAEDCVINGTDTGIRIKSRLGRGGAVENITCRRFVVRKVNAEAISIVMNYDSGSVPANPLPEEIPAYRNITIEDFTCQRARVAARLLGLSASPIEDLLLTNVVISADQGVDASYTQLRTENMTIRLRN